MRRIKISVAIIVLIIALAPAMADSSRFASGDSTDDAGGDGSRFDSGDSNDDSSDDSRFDSGDSEDDQNTDSQDTESDSESQDSEDTSDSDNTDSDSETSDSRFDSGDSNDDSGDDGSRFDSGDSEDDAGDDGSRFDSGDSNDDSSDDSRFDSGDSNDDNSQGDNSNDGSGSDDGSSEDDDNEEDSDPGNSDNSDGEDSTEDSSDGVSSIDWPDVIVRGDELRVQLSEQSVNVGENVIITGSHQLDGPKTVNVVAEGKEVFESQLDPGEQFRTGLKPVEQGNVEIEVSAGSVTRKVELEVVSGLELSDIDMPPVSDPGAVRACTDVSRRAEISIYNNDERQRTETGEGRFCTLVNLEEGENNVRFVARSDGETAEASTVRRIESGSIGSRPGIGGTSPSSNISGSGALGAFSGSETRLVGSVLAGLALVVGVLYREGVRASDILA